MSPSNDEDIMRRREFLATTLLGLAVPADVLDWAARLDPASADGPVAAQISELEAAVHARALEFPTVPTVDQLPRLIRDYGGYWHLVREARDHHQFRVENALSQLCAFIGGNLADWQDIDGAHAWYGAGLQHAKRVGSREAEAWIAARGTLLPMHQADYRQAIHDAALAVAVSPRVHLGSTLGNALAAVALARIGHVEAARVALNDARRAVDRQADQETFTAYSMPWYRMGRFASEVHTQLGEYNRARQYQEASIPGYPPRADTDVSYLGLDYAEGIAQQGDPRAAAQHATQVLDAIPARKSLPIIADRAVELIRTIGPAGGSHLDALYAATRKVRGEGEHR